MAESEQNEHFDEIEIIENIEEFNDAEEAEPTEKNEALEEIDDSEDKEQIQDASYGVNDKSRMVITYVITAAICAAVLTGSYFLAVFMPGDNDQLNESLEKLRQEESYSELLSEYSSLTYDVSKLKNSTEAKKAKVNSIEDADNTKAQLRSQIEEKKQQLSSLQSDITQKETELASLNEQIEKNSGSILTLPAGKYVVGKNNLPAGKYQVTGIGTLQIAANGQAKTNEKLGDTPLTVTLEKDDTVKIVGTVKFTPVG